MLLAIIIILIFASIALLSSQIISYLLEVLHRLQEKKVKAAQQQLEKMFVSVKPEKLFLYYTFSPLALGGVGFLLSRNLVVALIALLFGFALPAIALKSFENRRRNRFLAQLVDGLMLLVSSLRAGLSLSQAMEILTEEMPAPISQEFGLALRENRMGVTLEESLARLNKRMQVEELGLVVNAILVARETGGDLTKVLTRLANTIRDNRKLKESIKTLTLQGRLQGIIMSILPIAFVWWVLTFNRHHFDILLQNETGRILLFAAVILQVVGMLLIRKFSKIDL